jgi:hypothetical protein
MKEKDGEFSVKPLSYEYMGKMVSQEQRKTQQEAASK